MRMQRGSTEQRFKSFSIKKVALLKVVYLSIVTYLVYLLILVLAKGI